MAGDGCFDPGADRITIACRPVADQLQAEIVVPEALLVAQQQWRAANLREDDVKISVAVDIRVSAATPDDRLEQIRAGLDRADREEPDAFDAAVPEKLR